MPQVKIDYVVSFSSEDPDNLASNLLAQEISKKKWLCSGKGESCASVVLQLARSVRVSAVHVGAHAAALVEVLVGRSETPDAPYKVLVLSSVFMTPAESKRSEGMCKVRTFAYEQLAADARDQSWDRVRVVCLQPYNKHVKYGLSFIHIFEPEGHGSKQVTSTPVSKTPAPLPAAPSGQHFDVTAQSSDEEESFKPGDLFKLSQSQDNVDHMSTDAQIRQAGTPRSLKNVTESSAKLVKMSISKEKKVHKEHKTNEDKERMSRHRDDLLYTAEEDTPHDKIDKIVQRDRIEKEKKKTSVHTPGKRNDEKQHESRSEKQSERRRGHESSERLKADPHSKHRDRDANHNKASSDRKQRDARHSGHTRSDKDKTSQNGRESSGQKERDSKKRLLSSEKNDRERDAKRLRAGPRSASPHRLLAGVVLVLSGYVNPRRAALRDRALAMGARYRQDWSADCTHLICAFANTPKLKQVRSSGNAAIIVSGEWVEECCRRRRLLPWQWFATEPARRLPVPADDCSDPETPAPDPETAASTLTDDKECDTDDEIEKVLLEKKVREQECQSPVKKTDDAERKSPRLNLSGDSDVTFVADERIKANISLTDSESEASTDEETTQMEDIQINNESSLPDFFDGYTFAIDTQVHKEGLDVGLLKRYVTAYGGEMVEQLSKESEINYVLALSAGCEARRLVGGVPVRPHWVWACHSAGTRVSTKEYILN